MNRVSLLLHKIQFWIRSKPILYRFTLGIRCLLAVGFIPTGTVKLLGYRFTRMSAETDIGAFFEILYQAGPYWKFLGFAQVIAGIFVLIPGTSAIGALLFLGIMMNIFLITISYDFALTPVITFMMLLGSIWLVVWDFNHFRSLLFQREIEIVEKNREGASAVLTLPQPTLANRYERAIYVLGTVSGLFLFGMLRGLVLPESFTFVFLSVCSICFIVAIVLGVRYRH